MLNYMTLQARNPNIADSLRNSLLAWVFTNLLEISTQPFKHFVSLSAKYR